MKKKLFIMILCTILCTLLLTSCWDRQELNELGIVGAYALDKGENGEIILTAQIIRPSAIKAASGGGTLNSEQPVEIISSSGTTIFEAIRKISQKFDRRMIFSHAMVIVIDEALAREGIFPILDFLERSYEIRLTNFFVIAKGTTARGIISDKHGLGNIQATYLEAIAKNSRLNSFSSAPNILDFIKKALNNHTNPIGGVMEIYEQPVSNVELAESIKGEEDNVHRGIRMTGTAVFNKDKLIGFLDDIETRGLKWITGEVESSIINVPSLDEKDKFLVVEVKSSSSKIIPQITDGEISFTVVVNETGDIVEQQTLTDVSKLPVLKKVEDIQNEVIQKEIEGTIDILQKEFGSDIIGFGKALYNKYPDEWKRIQNDWEYIFPVVKYTVVVNTKIRKTGLLQKAVTEAKEGSEPPIESRDRSGNMLKEPD